MASVQEQIENLCNREFPEYRKLVRRRRLEAAVDWRSALKSGPIRETDEKRLKDKDLTEKFAQRKAELKKKTPDEIAALSMQAEVDQLQAEALKWEAQKQKEFQDIDNFFNHQTTQANFGHWAKKLDWTLDQAVALLLEKEPGHVYLELVRPFEKIHNVATKYVELMGLAVEHAQSPDGQLSDPVKPGVFLKWAHHYDYFVPVGLLEAVGRYDPSLQVNTLSGHETVQRNVSLMPGSTGAAIPVLVAVALDGSTSGAQTGNDASIIEILRDAARRILPFAPELGRKWEADTYAAAFITDELREIWHRCMQKRDDQEIYTACDQVVTDVWRRAEPMEKIPGSYISSDPADAAADQASPAPFAVSSVPQSKTNEPGLSKNERKIQAIEAAAVAQGYKVLSIPTGGKTLLRKLCIASRPDLFGAGPDPFNKAWKNALGSAPPRLRMAEHSKFIG